MEYRGGTARGRGKRYARKREWSGEAVRGGGEVGEGRSSGRVAVGVRRDSGKAGQCKEQGWQEGEKGEAMGGRRDVAAEVSAV